MKARPKLGEVSFVITIDPVCHGIFIRLRATLHIRRRVQIGKLNAIVWLIQEFLALPLCKLGQSEDVLDIEGQTLLPFGSDSRRQASVNQLGD